MNSLYRFSIENAGAAGKQKRDGAGTAPAGDRPAFARVRGAKKIPPEAVRNSSGGSTVSGGECLRYSTMVGVTKITSSCFLLLFELDEKILPRNGMSLSSGTPVLVFVSTPLISPPMTAVAPF
jgi:hypothetical protein